MNSNVNIKNLKLKRSVLDNVPFPAKLKHGSIGEIDVKLPSLFKLTGSALEVRIENIDIIFSLRDLSLWDEKTLAQEFENAKQWAL